MQFYARFQDEVVAAPATDRRARRARARAGLAAFRQIFDEALVEAHERLVAAPGDLAAKVRFVTIYHLILESTLGLTSFRFITDYLEREGLLPGLRRRLLEDPPRRDPAHRLRRLVPARDGARAPGAADTVRETLRDLLPSVAESLSAPRRRRTRLRAARRRPPTTPRVRARRADPPARDHRRPARDALTFPVGIRGARGR